MPAPPTIDFGSPINVKETIDKLIEVERQPIYRLDRDNKIYKAEIKIWEQLRVDCKTLAEKSRDLYSITGPFRKRVLFSEKPEALSGTAQDNAKKTRVNVKIRQLAGRHEVQTDAIDTQKKLKAGPIGIQVGKKKNQINFSGGSIQDLKKQLEEEAKDIIEISEFQASQGKVLLKLSSKVSGKEGALRFQDPNNILGNIGLLENKAKEVAVKFYKSNLKAISPTPPLDYKASKDRKSLHWKAGEVGLDLQETSSGGKGAQLSLELIGKKEAPSPSQKKKTSSKKLSSKKKIESIRIGPSISINVEELNLKAKKLQRTRSIPEQSKKKDQTKKGSTLLISTKLTLHYEDKGQLRQKSFTKNVPTKSKVPWDIDLEQIPAEAKIKSIHFHTQGEVIAKNLVLQSSPKPQPKNQSQAPKNAIIEVDGVELQRPRNTELTDVILGAKINLKKLSLDPFKVEIHPDHDKISDEIKEWVKMYNLLRTYLRENMRAAYNIEPGPVSEKEQGGILATDSTARRLFSQLDTVIAIAYPAKKDGYKILPEIGIHTGKLGSRWEDIKEGLLKIKEDTLKEALSTNPTSVQELFSSSNKKPPIIDNGVAYQMEQVLKPYAQRNNGLLSIRVDLLKEKIKSNKKKKSKKEEYLVRKRANLRNQFGRMEQAVKRNKSMGDYLKRFGPNNK